MWTGVFSINYIIQFSRKLLLMFVLNRAFLSFLLLFFEEYEH